MKHVSAIVFIQFHLFAFCFGDCRETSNQSTTQSALIFTWREKKKWMLFPMHAKDTLIYIVADNATSADTGPNRIFDFMKIKKRNKLKARRNGQSSEWRRKKKNIRESCLWWSWNTERAFPQICRKCNHRLLWRYEDNAPISNPTFPQEWISRFFLLHKSLMRYNSASFLYIFLLLLDGISKKRS